VNTFICPRCGQVLVLSAADKVSCSVCHLVIRVRGKMSSAHGPSTVADSGKRLFGVRLNVIVIVAIVLGVAVASVIWMLVANRNL
jgi:hypothetical protein